ncbi:hypothetical protein MKZ38_008900 [Zalerion maritima]|uniref:Uncharacterized protein n=1 Tax=Zalerion maritima TaxID=339359 RepID=A0AAD5S255_9PEZI|nr:hypothetical protein MKZ38_008900 [Zalerion maritima]
MIISAPPTPVRLVERETVTYVPDGFVVTENGRIIPWWYTKTGIIVKWSLFLAFILLVFGLSLAYWHAKKRMRKGVAPLAYHRWMITRAELSRVDSRYAYPQAAAYTSYNPQAHSMNPMAPPPPMYDPNFARPPMYEPPEGATKTDPSQWRSEPTRRPGDFGQQSGVQDSSEFAPPPGPPPPART